VSGGNILETLADPEFYDSIDHFQPREDEFLDLVKQLVSSDSVFARANGIWFGCFAPEGRRKRPPIQGWKIHVSSSTSCAQDVLRVVVPILVSNDVEFKFSLDVRILSLMNSKRWVRQGAGKFVTIYPLDQGQFVSLIEQLYQATRQFEGPYILSDRRYKDSKVIFYRYGGISSYTVLNVRGEKPSMLISPSGERVPDIRLPYFHVPDWAKDPFEATSHKDSQETPNPSEVLLKEGRYLVKSSLNFSNSGGVYVAQDTETGQEVVIKEARPFVDTIEDTVSLLKKEYRILSKIANLKIAPQPIDLFQDWEHFFLVQEYIKGGSIQGYSARNNITLRLHPTIEDTRTFYGNFRTIILQLAEIIKALHECGIVFSDLSPGNLILRPDTLELKIIDFEGAYEVGVDKPGQLYTPGFAADQMFGRNSTVESDYFSIGAIMHFFLSPVNQIFLVNPKARYTFMENVTRDIGFPKSICELATALIDKSPEKRPTPSEVIEVLLRDDEVTAPNFATDGPEADPTYRSYVKGIIEYILAVATYDRNDRLFPSDGAVFRTNPLSIAHGACGVAYAINKIEQKVPEEVVNWILARNKHITLIPPGLYIGLAGIAWAMLELGLYEESQKVLLSTHDHPLLYDSFDVYYGVAGWGLANLRFFMEFQDEIYLQKAEVAGNYLLENLAEDTRGCYWSSDENVFLGYAHGASGISLFLLYLYLASGKERFLDVGMKALDFDMNNATPYTKEEGVAWMRYADQGNIVYPYWKIGSTGVGMAMLRYYRLLGEAKYKDMLELIYFDTNKKYTLFPGLFNGLAGLGEFLLDLHQVTNESRHLDGAYRVATGLSLFKTERKQGLAFPGDMLRRISCDYGTGGGGIGHFLHRLTHREEGGFHLDRLFVNTEKLSEVC
jgi:serine/threonine protein kinase